VRVLTEGVMSGRPLSSSTSFSMSPLIAGKLVERRREAAEGDGDGIMMKSENRFEAAPSDQNGPH
jgi:hypothetical protein